MAQYRVENPSQPPVLSSSTSVFSEVKDICGSTPTLSSANVRIKLLRTDFVGTVFRIGLFSATRRAV